MDNTTHGFTPLSAFAHAHDTTQRKVVRELQERGIQIFSFLGVPHISDKDIPRLMAAAVQPIDPAEADQQLPVEKSRQRMTEANLAFEQELRQIRQERREQARLDREEREQIGRLNEGPPAETWRGFPPRRKKP